jgi:hypothetical protein
MYTVCIPAFQKLIWILLNKVFNTFPMVIWVFHGILQSIQANAQISAFKHAANTFSHLKLIIAEFDSMQQM